MRYTYIILCLILTSCGIEDLISPPDVRKQYEKALDDIELASWEKLSLEALRDSIIVDLPYQESIKTDSLTSISAGYILSLDKGKFLTIDVNSKSVLVDVFQFVSDSSNSLKPVYNPKFLSENYLVEIKDDGQYLIRVQPKLKTQHLLQVSFNSKPIYDFPVAGGKNSDIGSFWGDPRDAGKRIHKGIDIFAKKGTPLIAVSDARVSTVRNRGLGGKQIWLNDSKRNLNIYYAHLDSQYVKQGQRVFQGDTIGSVGNTGNARTTPPHLHFGIYKSFSGAIDPINYVKLIKPNAIVPPSPEFIAGSIAEINNAKANFRSSPSSKKNIIQVLQKGQKVRIIGISGNWYHVRTVQGQAGYLYKSHLAAIT